MSPIIVNVYLNVLKDVLCDKNWSDWKIISEKKDDKKSDVICETANGKII